MGRGAAAAHPRPGPGRVPHRRHRQQLEHGRGRDPHHAEAGCRFMSRHRRTGRKASRRPAIAITLPVPIWQHPGQSPQARAGSAELGSSGRDMRPELDSLRPSTPTARLSAAQSIDLCSEQAPQFAFCVSGLAGAGHVQDRSITLVRAFSRSARCPGPPPGRNLGDRRQRPVPGVRPGLAAARFHGRPSQHLAGRRGAGQCRRADPSRTL
jgi:hypothetical protein